MKWFDKLNDGKWSFYNRLNLLFFKIFFTNNIEVEIQLCEIKQMSCQSGIDVISSFNKNEIQNTETIYPSEFGWMWFYTGCVTKTMSVSYDS